MLQFSEDRDLSHSGRGYPFIKVFNLGLLQSNLLPSSFVLPLMHHPIRTLAYRLRMNNIVRKLALSRFVLIMILHLI